MKQSIAVITLLVLLAGSSQAQVGFGVTGGVNFANVGGADVPSSAKSITGFAAGVYADISIPFLFSIQPQVLYSRKGFYDEETVSILGTPYTVKATAHLDYIEVPVLIKYTLPVPIVNPALFAGPSVGILMSAKVKGEVAGFPSQETDIKSSTTSTDFGLVFGASANIAIINVSARYTMGLTTLDKEGSSKTYNRVWSLMVGIPL
jgi:hypothetical protein